MLINYEIHFEISADYGRLRQLGLVGVMRSEQPSTPTCQISGFFGVLNMMSVFKMLAEYDALQPIRGGSGV